MNLPSVQDPQLCRTFGPARPVHRPCSSQQTHRYRSREEQLRKAHLHRDAEPTASEPRPRRRPGGPSAQLRSQRSDFIGVFPVWTCFVSCLSMLQADVRNLLLVSILTSISTLPTVQFSTQRSRLKHGSSGSGTCSLRCFAA